MEEIEDNNVEFIVQEPIRYTYIFRDEITTESVQELIDILVGIPAVDLYVTTPGGEGVAMDILIKFINRHPDINIYLTLYIASAGTFFLTDCTQPVFLDDNLEFMLFHLGDRPVEGQFRKRQIDDKILYEQLKEMNNKLCDKYTSLGLNKKEIKSIMDGNDVILYKKDFKRIEKNIGKYLDMSK